MNRSGNRIFMINENLQKEKKKRNSCNRFIITTSAFVIKLQVKCTLLWIIIISNIVSPINIVYEIISLCLLQQKQKKNMYFHVMLLEYVYSVISATNNYFLNNVISIFNM